MVKEFKSFDSIYLRGKIHFELFEDMSQISSIRKESGMFLHKIVKNNLSPINI